MKDPSCQSEINNLNFEHNSSAVNNNNYKGNFYFTYLFLKMFKLFYFNHFFNSFLIFVYEIFRKFILSINKLS